MYCLSPAVDWSWSLCFQDLNVESLASASDSYLSSKPLDSATSVAGKLV